MPTTMRLPLDGGMIESGEADHRCNVSKLFTEMRESALIGFSVSTTTCLITRQGERRAAALANRYHYMSR